MYEEYLFSETFWKVRYVRNTKHTVELSDLECWNMVRNKKFQNSWTGVKHNISCVNEACEYIQPIVDKFKMEDRCYSSFLPMCHCSTEIIADSDDKHVFRLPCSAKNPYLNYLIQ